jgi:hypothetical protein
MPIAILLVAVLFSGSLWASEEEGEKLKPPITFMRQREGPTIIVKEGLRLLEETLKTGGVSELRRIGYKFSKNSEEQGDAFIDFLTRQREALLKLTLLDLSLNGVTNTGLEKLLLVLEGAKDLGKLILDGNLIDDRIVTSIFLFLKSHPSLESISMIGTEIGPTSNPKIITTSQRG